MNFHFYDGWWYLFVRGLYSATGFFGGTRNVSAWTWTVSRQHGKFPVKFPNNMEAFQPDWNCLQSCQTYWSLSRQPGTFPGCLQSFWNSWKAFRLFECFWSTWLSFQSKQWSLQCRVWCWRRTSEFVRFDDRLFRFQPETLWTSAAPQLSSQLYQIRHFGKVMIVFSCPGSSIPTLGHWLTATLAFEHK